MSETKHTPGELRVEQETALIWGNCNPDDNSSYGMGYPIAECRSTPSGYWAKGPKGWEEAEANAARIALTWNCHDELVAALHDALFWLEGALQCDKFEWSTDQGSIATDALERGRAVIALSRAAA